MACFWCHDVIAYFDFMTNVLTSWRTFHVFLTLYDVLLMSSHVFNVMANFLTTWRKFWRYELLMLWRTFWGYDVINTSWQHKHNTQPNRSTYKYIASPDGWAVWGVVMSTRWWLLVDHCVLRNWDRILVRAVKGLISRAGMVSICPLLWQRDVKLQQTKHTNTSEWWCGQTLLGRHHVHWRIQQFM